MTAVTALILALLALGALAFGAVYPWAYGPLFAAAAIVGAFGMYRGGIPRPLRPLGLALLLAWMAAALQLLPVPQSLVERLSPATVAILQTYSLSFPLTEWVPLSIEPASTRVAVLAAGALALYVIGLPSLLTGPGLRSLPRALAMFTVPFALFSIYSREYQNGLIYWFWQPVEGGGANQFGPFVNRNHYGAWMLMAACLLIGWLFGHVERGRRQQDGRRLRAAAWLSSADGSSAILMALAVLVAVISLFWTLSRSSMLAFAAAAALFGWLVLTRARLEGAGRAMGVTAVGALLVAGITWRGPLRLLEWFQDNNLASRLDAWRDGWDVIRAFPWFGTGLNTYSVAMLFYQTRNPGFYMSRAHNDYVQLAAEGGALVAVPAVVAMAALALAVRRNLRAARAEARGYWIRAGAAVGVTAVAVQETLEFSLQIPANALLFCTLTAIALTPTSSSKQVQSAK